MLPETFVCECGGGGGPGRGGGGGGGRNVMKGESSLVIEGFRFICSYFKM